MPGTSHVGSWVHARRGPKTCMPALRAGGMKVRPSFDPDTPKSAPENGSIFHRAQARLRPRHNARTHLGYGPLLRDPCNFGERLEPVLQLIPIFEGAGFLRVRGSIQGGLISGPKQRQTPCRRTPRGNIHFSSSSKPAPRCGPWSALPRIPQRFRGRIRPTIRTASARRLMHPRPPRMMSPDGHVRVRGRSTGEHPPVPATAPTSTTWIATRGGAASVIALVHSAAALSATTAPMIDTPRG